MLHPLSAPWPSCRRPAIRYPEGVLDWVKNPRVARRLASATWAVLVIGFFAITGRGAQPTYIGVGVLVTLVALMQVPVLYGLHASRAQRATKAYRVVAIALSLRVVATAAITVVLLRG